MMPGQAMLTATAVAEAFGVTLRTLANWERDRVLIPQRIQGRRYYPVTAVEALIENGHRRYDRRPATTDT